MTLNGHDDVTLGQTVAIVLQEVHFQRVVDDAEDPLPHLGAAEDAVGFGHHLGGVLRLGGYAGQRGVVAVAHVFAQGRFNQFVKVLNMRHNYLVI